MNTQKLILPKDKIYFSKLWENFKVYLQWIIHIFDNSVQINYEFTFIRIYILIYIIVTSRDSHPIVNMFQVNNKEARAS